MIGVQLESITKLKDRLFLSAFRQQILSALIMFCNPVLDAIAGSHGEDQ